MPQSFQLNPLHRPTLVSLDLTAIDKSIDPCVDFYRYSCGNWMKNNPVPADKSRWGRFDGLAEQNIYVLRDILVQTQAPGQHSPTEKKVGAFYASCMDEATIETKGTAPLQAQTGADRRDQLESRPDQAGRLHASARHPGDICFLWPARHARLDGDHRLHRPGWHFAS